MNTAVAYTWGTTAAERSLPFPCDRELPKPQDAYFRAVDVHAPAAVLFSWLCQLRVAPYSYDLIDNFGRRSPSVLTPGLDDLEVGQRVMTIFDLVEFERDRHLTLRVRRGARLFGDVAVSYVIRPTPQSDRCRLLVKVSVSHPGGLLVSRLRQRLLPWGDLVMMRRQLLNLKLLAEA